LLPHQLKRLARRASLGLARTGSVSGNGSGDLFIAFSTAIRMPPILHLRPDNRNNAQ
jgi:L-aminopeptidase/D-esterase-like protein